MKKWDCLQILPNPVGPEIDFDSTKLISKTEHYSKRIIMEAIEIEKHPQNMNKWDDTSRLPDIWKPALKGIPAIETRLRTHIVKQSSSLQVPTTQDITPNLQPLTNLHTSATATIPDDTPLTHQEVSTQQAIAEPSNHTQPPMNAKLPRHWENKSTVNEFVLLGFRENPVLFFAAFLAVYLTVVLGNSLVVIVTTRDLALHTPMYLFLRSLSGLEVCYTSVTLPKMIASLATGDHSISLEACASQMFFMLFLGGAECFLLTAMAYDRYLAICLPLHYMTIMNQRMLIGLVFGSFVLSFPMQLVQIGLIFSLPFCGPNEMDHFFCDMPAVLSLACADISTNELLVYIENVIFALVSLVVILTSYVYITRTILHMPSAMGRQKAFSTCSSHVIVVSLFYGSGMLVYLHPQTTDSIKIDKLLSLLYTIIIPLCNPLIYTLRNKEVKAALKRLFTNK
ncbi:olfactory receptor 10A7-like [Erythrolamprus reginae]|uniref:olfactory receptor 10A7-like n=1 Tax=Erythrolamprus reginae TaxID=121349 RepID=UPI00396C3B1C